MDLKFEANLGYSKTLSQKKKTNGLVVWLRGYHGCLASAKS
jgi:hypothetical protein